MLKGILRKTSLVTAALAVVLLLSPGLVAAQSRAAVCEGVGTAAGDADAGCAGGEGSVNNVISTAVEILSVIVGIAAVVMIMVGSFKIVTSNGDAGKVASGRQTVVYALVGVVIAVLAQVIVRYVLNRAVN